MQDIVLTALVTVSATIGKPGLVLFGYASPRAVIKASGIGVADSTVSDSTGYFRFDNILTPAFTFPEICIQATDRNDLDSQPTCIPSLPSGALKYSVGPVYLSPTMSFSDNNVVRQGFASASGTSVPNSDIEIYIAKDESSNKLALVREANAYYVPVYKTRTDGNGRYEFSLPTSDTGVYRIFAGTKIGEDPSAKSTTLTFSVISRASAFWQAVWNFIRTHLIAMVIGLEVFIILLLLFFFVRRARGRRRLRHSVSKAVL